MKRFCLLWAGLALTLCPLAERGETTAARAGETALTEAAHRADNELGALRERLSLTRDRIAAERLAAETELAALEADVVRLREECDARIEEAETFEAALRHAEDESSGLAKETRAVWTSLLEIRRTAEAAFTVLDRDVFKRQLAQADAALAHQDTESALVAGCEAVLALLVDHAEAGTEPRRMAGEAIGRGGEAFLGTFIQVGGGIALFVAAADDGPAGPMFLERGNISPHVDEVAGESDRRALRDLVEGQSASVPLDVTSGGAVKGRRTERTLAETFKAGGSLMYPLLSVALVCLALGAWKAVELWRMPVPAAEQMRAFGRALSADRQTAGRLADGTRGPLRRVFREAVVCAGAPRERLEELLRDAVLAEMPGLESKLGALAVGIAVAPLLGLLGTVTGMIHTFRMISLFGTGDARLLSGGISEALITTEAGLSIAIPLLLLHAALTRRAKKLADGLENGVSVILEAYPDAAAGDTTVERAAT